MIIFFLFLLKIFLCPTTFHKKGKVICFLIEELRMRYIVIKIHGLLSSFLYCFAVNKITIKTTKKNLI